MDNIFIVAAVISIVFLLLKFAEMRVIDKESKPLKCLVRDTLLVYFCVIFGNFVFEQLKPVMSQVGGGESVKAPAAFTGNPEF
jgi:hypothetical protein